MCEERNGRIELAELADLIDERTRLVAISHVQFASGFRINLEALGQVVRRYDALLAVDTIQSLGVIPLAGDSEYVDVAAGACHKWLLTPEGLGYLYLSDRARERIQPTLVGWVSVPNPEDYGNFAQGWNRDTLAWETGTVPTSLFYGLEASLRLLSEAGTARIATYLFELTDYLCNRLDSSRYEVVSSRETSEKSQIVCLRHRGHLSAMELYAHLRQHRIITAPRGDRLRVAPHLYNTTSEIDEFVSRLP